VPAGGGRDAEAVDVDHLAEPGEVDVGGLPAGQGEAGSEGGAANECSNGPSLSNNLATANA
jgi:hypothetical protein